MSSLPKISIIIPTLNSASTLGACLDSIAVQDYPKENIEVIFADGGSRDKTQVIIESFQKNTPEAKSLVVPNPLKTGEAGKAAGFKRSACEIIAFIDSDNILDGTSWLRQMVEPFDDAEIVASEPIRYTYRKTDGAITRYCALMGMNDPLCYFLGNYDRECVLSGRWTRMPYQVIEDNGRYLKLRLDCERMPTIGANGFFIRRQALEEIGVGDYLFDIDVLVAFLSLHPEKTIAKATTGITHIFSGNIKNFWKKQCRRISDFRRFKKFRKYRWGGVSLFGLSYFCLSCVALFPLPLQAISGYRKKHDFCWFLHPLLCLLTFAAYAQGCIFRNRIISREKWQLDNSK